MDLLDKMVEILGEETVNRQEFRQLLESGLSQAKSSADSAEHRSR